CGRSKSRRTISGAAGEVRRLRVRGGRRGSIGRGRGRGRRCTVVCERWATASVRLHRVDDRTEGERDGVPGGELGAGDCGALDLVLVLAGVVKGVPAGLLDVRACCLGGGAGLPCESLRLRLCALGEALGLRSGLAREASEGAPDALGDAAGLLL